MDSIDRRTFIGGASSVLLGGLVAGCAGGNGGNNETTTEETSTAATTEGTGTEMTTEGTSTETTTTNTASTGSGDVPQEVSSWLEGAAGYDGSVKDSTGSGSATVKVGANSEDGYFAFKPAAVRVSTGTEVTWEWTGEGGAHNVVEKSNAFTSGEAQSGSDITYKHTFEEAGTYLYYCGPHRSLGMKGAVIVEE